MTSRRPDGEVRRLEALRRYHILDTPPEPAFDDLTRITADVCDAPIAVINLIDKDRQWFKSEIGLGVRETPLDVSICAHAILQPGLFIVPDTREDGRFSCNPLVSGEPFLRFYAGALLETSDGFPLGTLCVLDYEPRELSDRQKETLSALARQVMLLLELRRVNALQAEMLMDLENARAQLAVLAATDHLTGMANRRSFSDRLRQEHAAIQREDSSACLLMADLDHFKKVNDVYGHHVGDEALRTFAAVCERVLRTSDMVGRWGGEEFIILLPNTPASQAVIVAERLRETFSATPIPAAGDPLFCTTSIGMVAMTAGRKLDDVLRDLDAALYRAKEQGRDQTTAA